MASHAADGPFAKVQRAHEIHVDDDSRWFEQVALLVVIHQLYRLSDGFEIPGNTQIGVPTSAILMDPKLYHDPKRYDGFRFAKIRNQEPNTDASDRAQYAASNPASMSFGFGRNACPGRFFAANEIKAIMGYLCLNYDRNFEPGSRRGQRVYFSRHNIRQTHLPR